jgi:hypothetical protein
MQDPADSQLHSQVSAGDLYTNESVPSSTLVFGREQLQNALTQQSAMLSFMRKSPSMCLKFLNSNARDGHANTHGVVNKKGPKSSTSVNGISYPVSHNHHNYNPLTKPNEQSRGKSNSIDSSPPSTIAPFQNNINCPHFLLLTFHPSGTLKVHRIRLEGVHRDQGAAAMGRALVDGAAGVVGMGTGSNAYRKDDKGEEIELVAKYGDALEWQVLRCSDWRDVKSMHNTLPSTIKSNGINLSNSEALSRKWLSQAEIATHTTSRTSLPLPLFLTQQFTLQTFGGAEAIDDIKQGKVPKGEKVEIREVECVNGCSEGGDGTAVVEAGKVVGLDDISGKFESMVIDNDYNS